MIGKMNGSFNASEDVHKKFSSHSAKYLVQNVQKKIYIYTYSALQRQVDTLKKKRKNNNNKLLGGCEIIGEVKTMIATLILYGLMCSASVEASRKEDVKIIFRLRKLKIIIGVKKCLKVEKCWCHDESNRPLRENEKKKK